MRDRLRAVQCPSDIIDQIGGWQTAGVGQGYGTGYELGVLYNWLEKSVGAYTSVSLPRIDLNRDARTM